MDGKLGTFAGVFTPSLLTILGVIMYLRMPWLVGNAGLHETLLIMAAAEVVAITTGLSIASIATDKKVGVGGSYYILSRSLGLPIGGSIGLALFGGLSFSIALHLVGFSASLLHALGIEPTANAIRVCGTLTLLGVGGILFVSTSLAIKTQYIIFALVGASLLSIFLGHSHPGAVHPMHVAKGSPSFAVLFGIFFPACTGFTTGLNMSGDLRDPKGSIPVGTIAAILAAGGIYLALVLFLVYHADAGQLRNDPQVLEHIALFGPAVIAGLWGASLSSALGAIMGAPRILQAMSTDRITPRIFAAGRGPTNEPRNALFLAAIIGELGVLMANIDAIARVISTVYLALYGAICLTCAIESWANPDFRPRFKVWRPISIVGVVACAVLMIQLDLVATAAAIALLLGLYGYLKRRQLTLEAGGAWEGIWSTLVRAGLQRLHQTTADPRSWRPNVLLFDEAGQAEHPAIRAFAATLASGNGMVTDFALARDKKDAADPPAPQLGVFDARIVTDEPLATIATVAQHHGFPGVPPNTLLLPWRIQARQPVAFVKALGAATDRGLNILLFEEARTPTRAAHPRIDLWWAPEAGNLALGVALVRFITRAHEWERATLTVLISGDGSDGDALLRAKAVRFLEGARVDAKVRVIVRPPGEALHDLVCNESRPADLVLLGLPVDLSEADHGNLGHLARVASLPGGVVFLRASDAFPDVLAAPRAVRAADHAAPATEDASAAAAPELTLPSHPELAEMTTALLEQARTRFGGLHDRALAACAPYFELCDQARALVVQRAEALSAAAREAAPHRRRRAADRATAAFATGVAAALERLTDDELAAQATLLADELTAIGATGAALPPNVATVVRVERPRADFRAAPDDDRALRRWKRRRRWRYFYRRKIAQTIEVGVLGERAHERLACEEAGRTIGRFRATSHDLAIEVGRVLASTEWKLHAQVSRRELELDETLAQIATARDAALRRLDGVREHARQKLAEDRAALEAAAVATARRLAAQLDRVEAPLLARAAGKRRRDDATQLAALPATAEAWRERQAQIVARLRVAAKLARFHDRLTVASARHLDDIATGVAASGQRACSELRDRLAVGAPLVAPESLPFDPAPAIARFARTAGAASGELPDSQTLLTDGALAALVRGDAAIETTTVSVRSTVQGLVESELIARLGAEALKLAEADARAWAAAGDTVALLSAQPGDNDEDDVNTPTAAPIDDARDRLDVQLGKLRDALGAFERAVVDGLDSVAAAISPDTLCAALEARSGRERERSGASSARRLARRALAGVRDLAARAVYRRSAGVVFARELHASRDRAAHQAIRELTARASVKPAVLAALPLYYRNLYTAQININEAFFAGRGDQVDAGAGALRGERRRAVLITGPRGAGKTTLANQIATAGGGDVHWVAPPGEVASRAALRTSLETALGGSGSPAQQIARLPAGATLVVDDLELWWERRPGGLDAIDELLDVVASAADRVGVVLAGGAAAMRVLGALRPIASAVAEHVACRPLTARELEDVVLSRHRSTGLRLRLGKHADDALGPWRRARLFDAHFDYSGGNVGHALRAWVAHIDGFADDVVSIRAPQPLDWDAIDDLAPEHVAVLIELVLHKQADAAKLARITGEPVAAMRAALGELTAMGLAAQNRRQVAHVNPFVYVPVLEYLRRRELA